MVMQRILHLGLGNFHRAHQAYYTAKSGDWRIHGVVMRNQGLYDNLMVHQGRYLLGVWDVGGLSAEVMDIYDDIILASDNTESVIAAIADEAVTIITLTITEKGYYLTSDGKLDVNNDVISDELISKKPQTAIGLLAAGLARRAAGHGAPITVISCDNLSENGSKLQAAMAAYCAQAYPQLIEWLGEHVRFPNTMVDRITPRLSQQASDEITVIAPAGKAGLPVVGTEAFSEWIIEDDFASHRPEWERSGVEIVADVKPFEDRKLRLLNASHSYLAYAGLLQGYEFVHEAINDAGLSDQINQLWDEAEITISAPASHSINAYRKALLARFSVPAMRHQLAQIAMDGSLKIRERFVPIIKQRHQLHLLSPASCFGIASWLCYCYRTCKAGKVVVDAKADKITQLATSADDILLFAHHMMADLDLPDEAQNHIKVALSELTA